MEVPARAHMQIWLRSDIHSKSASVGLTFLHEHLSFVLNFGAFHPDQGLDSVDMAIKESWAKVAGWGDRLDQV